MSFRFLNVAIVGVGKQSTENGIKFGGWRPCITYYSTVVWQSAGGVSLILPDVRFGLVFQYWVTYACTYAILAVMHKAWCCSTALLFWCSTLLVWHHLHKCHIFQKGHPSIRATQQPANWLVTYDLYYCIVAFSFAVYWNHPCVWR